MFELVRDLLEGCESSPREPGPIVTDPGIGVT
jgi:hypothetical protein